MTQWWRWVAVSPTKSGDLSMIPAGCWNSETLCLSWAFLRGTEPVSALTSALLYCCALYDFFFLGFVMQPRADRALTLKMNIWLPLFWSTWSSARGPDSATCEGLVHGRDYSDCRASAETKCPKSTWPMNCLKYMKKGPIVRVFHPPDWPQVSFSGPVPGSRFVENTEKMWAYGP